MKLATYDDGSRDGQLVVVSRDLSMAHFAAGIAGRLQQLLDDWNFIAPQLQDLYQTLNGGKARHADAFEPARCMAPLPRAFHWAAACGDGDLSQLPADPLLPAARLSLRAQGGGCHAGFVAVIGDLESGATPAQALDSVRLLMFGATVRHGETAPGTATGIAIGTATGFAPIAVTPDELGAAWRDGSVALPVRGAPADDAADAATAAPDLGRLIATASRTGVLRSGALIGGLHLPLDVGAQRGAITLDALDGDRQSVFGSLLLRRAAGAVNATGAPAAHDGAS